MDSGTPASPAPSNIIPNKLFTAPTTVIMPANAANTKNMTLSMKSGGEGAGVSCYFIGATIQGVTVSYTEAGSEVSVTMNGSTPGDWTSIPNTIPQDASGVTVSAGGAPNIVYTHSESYPIKAGGQNLYGINISKYYDDGPDTVYVAVYDAAVIAH